MKLARIAMALPLSMLLFTNTQAMDVTPVPQATKPFGLEDLMKIMDVETFIGEMQAVIFKNLKLARERNEQQDQAQPGTSAPTTSESLEDAILKGVLLAALSNIKYECLEITVKSDDKKYLLGHFVNLEKLRNALGKIRSNFSNQEMVIDHQRKAEYAKKLKKALRLDALEAALSPDDFAYVSSAITKIIEHYEKNSDAPITEIIDAEKLAEIFSFGTDLGTCVSKAKEFVTTIYEKSYTALFGLTLLQLFL